MNEIGMRLVELRGDRTREEIAAGIGVSKSAIAMYERGERIPKDDIKIKVAEFFGVTVEKLFYGEEI